MTNWLLNLINTEELDEYQVTFDKHFSSENFLDITNALEKVPILHNWKFEISRSASGTFSFDKEDVFVSSIRFAGIVGIIKLIVPSIAITSICKESFGEEPSLDEVFLSAIMKFISLEVIVAISSLQPWINHPPSLVNSLSPGNLEGTKDIGSYLEVICRTPGPSISVRIFAPKEFQKDWEHNFTNIKSNKENALYKSSVSISLEIATTKIDKEELQSINVGDWIALTNTGFSQEGSSPIVNLVLNGTIIGSGLFNGNEVTIKTILNESKVKR